MGTAEPKDADGLHRQSVPEQQNDVAGEPRIDAPLGELVVRGGAVRALDVRPVEPAVSDERTAGLRSSDRTAPADKIKAGEPAAPVEREAAPAAPADDTKILKDITAYLFPQAAPANDDRESVGALLRTLRAKKSRRPEIAAGIVMAFWLLLCIALLRSGAQSGAGMLGPDPVITLLAVAGFVFTIFLMVGVAIRSLDVQSTLRDLVRLVVFMADENTGSDKPGVVVGEAKSQVSALDEAIERTVARANELDTLLNSDRLDFERSFNRTEARYRELFDKLGVERASILANTEQLRANVESSHESLGREISAASTNFSRLLADTHTRLNESMDERASELLRLTTEVGDKNTDKWQAAIESAFLRATEQLEDRSERFSSNLGKQSNELDATLAGRLRETFDLFNRQADDVQEKSSARLEAMTRQVTRLLERMDVGINERSDAINNMLAARILDIGKTFKEGRNDLSQTLQQVSEITQGLSDATDRVNKASGTQITMLNTTVVEPMKAATTAFEQMSRSFLLGLADQLTSMNQMTRHSQDASESFSKEVTAFERALEQSVGAMKTTISASIADAQRSFVVGAEHLGETLRRGSPIPPPAAALPAQTLPAPVSPIGSAEATVARNLPAPRITPAAEMAERRAEPRPSEPRQAEPRSGIVTPDRTGRDGQAQPTRVDPPRAEPVRAEPARTEATRAEPARSEAPHADAQRAEATRIEQSRSEADKLETGRPEAEVKSNRGSKEGGKSWLSDLLARASVEEIAAVATPREASNEEMPSLTSISSNVDDLISDNRLRDAWDSYRRGGENLFRKAYTERGTQIFDRIREGFASDDDLRQSIQHYTSEFERLLTAGYDGSDDDDALMAFLLTGPGKVYTLLAHASGRLS